MTRMKTKPPAMSTSGASIRFRHTPVDEVGGRHHAPDVDRVDGGDPSAYSVGGNRLDHRMVSVMNPRLAGPHDRRCQEGQGHTGRYAQQHRQQAAHHSQSEKQAPLGSFVSDPRQEHGGDQRPGADCHHQIAESRSLGVQPHA